MTQVPEETPDSLVPEVPDDDLRYEEVDPAETSRDFPPAGRDSDPASFLNPQ
jgi:hypothetical protein